MDSIEGRESSHEVMLVIGTRPEIIKAAPLVREIVDTDSLYLSLIHTGQHYDNNLSGEFFDVLKLPQPDKHLEMGSGEHYEQTSRGIAQLGKVINTRDSAIVLAVGDTNTVEAAAIATSKMEVPFGHIEAGIRSYDRTMPEETNRIIADHLAEIGFAPTTEAKKNLAEEGMTDAVYVTGNPVVDACIEHSEIAENTSNALQRFEVEKDEFVLATIHRERNVTDTDRLSRIVESLVDSDTIVVFPLHPRTKNAIEKANLSSGESVILTDPLDYLDFLNLLSNARAIITDSGGIQEEASVLETPCLTVRPNTERPETVAAGVNKLVKPEEILPELNTLIQDDTAAVEMTGSPELYGDGTAAESILSLIVETVGK